MPAAPDRRSPREPARAEDPRDLGREGRASRALAWASSLGLAAVAGWESAGPILAGHYASTASVGIIADNALRWGVLGPVWSYTASPPSPDQVYCHHPWGIFWLTTAVVATIGRSDLACRLAPILLSALTPLLLHALGSRLWRPAAGAAAAIAFVSTPIVLSFAAFNALEVPLIAWTCLGLWGWSGLLARPSAPRRRDVAALAVGSLLAAATDWPGLVTFGLVAMAELVSAFQRRRRGEPWARRLAAGASVAAALLLVLGFHLVAFHRLGKLEDLLGAAQARSGGHGAPFIAMLASRRLWLELSFTKLGLLLIGLSLPLAAWRAHATGAAREWLPAVPFAASAFQYFVFRQGADVHVFWPHTFAVSVALAAGGLVATGAATLERRGRSLSRSGLIALAPAAIGAGLMLSDGVATLRWARESGGRFDEKGLLVDAEGEMIAALRALAPELPEGDGDVVFHPGMRPHWAQTWSLPRPIRFGGLPPDLCGGPAGEGGTVAWVADRRRLPPQDLIAAALRCHVRAIGPLLVVTPGPWAPIEAERFVVQMPSPLERYLVSGSQPRRTRAPDPFGTWEVRAHLGQPLEPPAAPPRTVDELRIAHNLALDRGDRAEAEGFLGQLRAIGRPLEGQFDDGTEVISVHRGSSPGSIPGSPILLILRAGGPLDLELSVRGRNLDPRAWGLTMRDPKPRELALPPRIPFTAWRRGWLYAVELSRPRRPGAEVITAELRSRAGGGPTLRSTSGEREIELWRDEP